MASIERCGDELHIETDRYTAALALTGYTSGVRAGSFRDRETGAVDLGFGLDIVDFLLEPEAGKSQDPAMSYPSGDAFHGNLRKRYVEMPQICTQAKVLPAEIFFGRDFVAVRVSYQWTQAAAGYRVGSRWEQTLVFQDGLRYFLSCDTVRSANDSDGLILRIDLPGHLKHREGDTFSAVYLSYHGEIPAAEFARDFPPDARFLYQRRDHAVPDRMIRAYRPRLADGPGPWLAGITLDPADVYEAWCHQRGYVCFIEEIGGRPVRAGQAFGAAYAIGWFDSVGEMEEVADQWHGRRGICIGESARTASWEWRDELL